MFRVQLGFYTGEEILRGSETNLRKDHVGFRPAHSAVEHVARGTAAMVAFTKEVQPFGQSRIQRLALLEILGEVQRLDFPSVTARKVSQNPAAVRGLPPEKFQWELVGFIPAHFLGYEVIDSRLLVNLRQLPVVSEGVRVPADADVDAVFLA